MRVLLFFLFFLATMGSALAGITESFDYSSAVLQSASSGGKKAVGGAAQELPGTTQSYDANNTTLQYHEWKMLLERNRLIYCVVLSLTAVISLAIMLWFLTKSKHSAENIVSASGLVFIIFGTIILVILASADAQLTAAIGVMGAIAGYLFGSIQRGRSPRNSGEE